MKNLKELEGKKVKFILNTGRIYTGNVLEVEIRGYSENGSLVFITIKDKYNFKVGFLNSEIKSYEEVYND